MLPIHVAEIPDLQLRFLLARSVVSSLRMYSLFEYDYFPLVFQANKYEVEAFLTLFWHNANKSSTYYMLIQNAPEGEKYHIDLGFYEHLTVNYIYKPKDSTNLLVVVVEWDASIGAYKINLNAGVTLKMSDTGSYDMVTPPNSMNVRVHALWRFLYKCTGNSKYLVYLYSHGQAHKHVIEVDPKGYYHILGLDPNVLLNLPDEAVSKLIGYSKRALAMSFHPDVRDPSLGSVYDLYLNKVMEAADVLSDPNKRLVYTSWLPIP